MIKTTEVKETMSKPQIHQNWEKNFRNDKNEEFFELAFEDIANTLKSHSSTSKSGISVLDAGCGSCRHSPRLARRGLDVTAIDYSEYIVEKAIERVNDLGLEDKITVKHEDLLSLSFEDSSFDHVVCWGVLMHIPDIKTAISELVRVLKPGGIIAISEINMNSIEMKTLARIRPYLRKTKVSSKRTEIGLETWVETENGQLLSRNVDVDWLLKEFEENGASIIKRKSGQFTELYRRFDNKLIHSLIHGFNNFWFKHIHLAGPASGNLIYFKKNK